MDNELVKEKLILQYILMGLMGYEVTALQTKKVPTITAMLKRCPKYGSAAILSLLGAAMVDHIYFQKVFP